MAQWQPAGNNGFTGYNPTAGNGNLVDNYYFFDSNGIVDLEAPMRAQSDTTPQVQSTRRLNATARIAFDGLDYAAAYTTDNARRLSATLYIIRDSSITGTVTTAKLWAARNLPQSFQHRSSVIGPPDLSTPIPSVYPIEGPPIWLIQPNTKYWALLMPTMVRPGQPASDDAIIPALPVNGNKDNSAAAIGRAISFWGNRPPSAPVITSPADGTERLAGSTLNLTLSLSDPDDASSGTYASNLAGLQVQMSPAPSPDLPNPAWTDVTTTSTASASTYLGGWFIKNSLSSAANHIFTTKIASGSQSIPVHCGTTGAASGHILIPSGDWRIRARVFDFGHSAQASAPPAGDNRAAPSTFPASSTSPWSTPVTISILSSIPAPTPISPTGGAALAANETAEFLWRYRSSATPPSPQSGAYLEIRSRTDSGWTSWSHLASVVGSNPYYRASPAALGLSVGKEYEWRVRTTDSLSATSDFSANSAFWVVSGGGSGSEFPVPETTIDGATLGCGTHRVFIYKRGGMRRVGEITGTTKIEWNRVRDEISTAQIEVQDWGVDCGDLLKKLQSWAYEVVIFRENGFGSERVWEGPITLLTYEKDKVTIKARDVMVYAYRRIMRVGGNKATIGGSVVTRATSILRDAMATEDPNILAYLQPIHAGDDATQYRNLPDYSRTAYEEVDDLASNFGLDYTTVGRAILLWGTKNRVGTLPEFRDEDLGDVPIVSEYGMSFANRYAISDGNGVWGASDRKNSVSGNYEPYGLVEVLSSSWATDEEPVTYSAESRAKVVASFEESSEQSLSSRFPPPVVVRVPDNTSLNPGVPISIQHLVPGVAIPLRSTGTLREVAALQKLDTVRVVEEAGVETISITLSPFARQDGSTEETE